MMISAMFFLEEVSDNMLHAVMFAVLTVGPSVDLRIRPQALCQSRAHVQPPKPRALSVCLRYGDGC